MVSKNKSPNDILLDLRSKFRDATTRGTLSGDQRAIFELTMIQILNEAEEQRQKCLKLQADHERDAARAGAQANSFNMIQNIVSTVFGNVIDKVQEAEGADEEDDLEDDERTPEEIEALKALTARQDEARAKRSKTSKKKTSKKTTKKTTKKTASK